MNKKLLGLFGLTFNPFSPEVPTEAFRMTPPLDSFFWKWSTRSGMSSRRSRRGGSLSGMTLSL